MKIFVSYRSSNRALVEELVSDLESIGHSVWFDKQLEGGQKWWDNILLQIQQCDLLIFALTPQSVDSYPCQLEYTYANALKRLIIPVMLAEGVQITLLPVILQERQIVDYRKRDKAAFIALSRALAESPFAPPLPNPLPDAPPAPISPLAGIKAQIDAPTLTFEQQTALLYQLKTFASNPEYSSESRALLERLSNHPSLLAAILRDIQAILQETLPQKVQPVQLKPASTVQSPPPNTTKLPDWAKLRPDEKPVRLYSQLSTKGSFATLSQNPNPLVVTNQRLIFHILNRQLISLELKDISVTEKTQVNMINPSVRIQTRNNDQFFLILYATPFTYENREEFMALVEQLRNAL